MFGEESSWDVDPEAEKLNRSLFGDGAKDTSPRKAKKKKRKHVADSAKSDLKIVKRNVINIETSGGQGKQRKVKIDPDHSSETAVLHGKHLSEGISGAKKAKKKKKKHKDDKILVGGAGEEQLPRDKGVELGTTSKKVEKKMNEKNETLGHGEKPEGQLLKKDEGALGTGKKVKKKKKHEDSVGEGGEGVEHCDGLEEIVFGDVEETKETKKERKKLKSDIKDMVESLFESFGEELVDAGYDKTLIPVFKKKRKSVEGVEEEGSLKKKLKSDALEQIGNGSTKKKVKKLKADAFLEDGSVEKKVKKTEVGEPDLGEGTADSSSKKKKKDKGLEVVGKGVTVVTDGGTVKSKKKDHENSGKKDSGLSTETGQGIASEETTDGGGKKRKKHHRKKKKPSSKKNKYLHLVQKKEENSGQICEVKEVTNGEELHPKSNSESPEKSVPEGVGKNLSAKRKGSDIHCEVVSKKMKKGKDPETIDKKIQGSDSDPGVLSKGKKGKKEKGDKSKEVSKSASCLKDKGAKLKDNVSKSAVCVRSNKLPFDREELRKRLSFDGCLPQPRDEEQEEGSEEDGSSDDGAALTRVGQDVGDGGRDVKKSEPGKKQPKSLREKMMERLNSARFRFINEELYTSTGDDAFKMFQEDRQAFDVYHEGYRQQVDKWPVNPLDKMIEYLKGRSKDLIVADFGCGEAKLAQSVQNKVHSFDLVAVNKYVTACNMSNVTLQNGSVDVAVFCLSLMGTNLAEYLWEANRVMKKGGVLLVAEVVSRLDRVNPFIRQVEEVGFIFLKKDKTNKMFIMFEFKKTGKAPSKDQLQPIELLPCLYKKR